MYILLEWSCIIILKYVEYDETDRIIYNLAEVPRIHRNSDFSFSNSEDLCLQEYGNPILEWRHVAEPPVTCDGHTA